MWMALLGPLPKPAWFGNGAKIGYIVAVRLIQSVLANALLWSSGVLYPRYAAGEAYWGISPANDQSAAGAIMMIEGSIVTILLFGWLFLKAARESEERQQLLELAAARGVELSEERAARAVCRRAAAKRCGGASSTAEMSPTRGSARRIELARVEPDRVAVVAAGAQDRARRKISWTSITSGSGSPTGGSAPHVELRERLADLLLGRQAQVLAWRRAAGAPCRGRAGSRPG